MTVGRRMLGVDVGRLTGRPVPGHEGLGCLGQQGYWTASVDADEPKEKGCQVAGPTSVRAQVIVCGFESGCACVCVCVCVCVCRLLFVVKYVVCARVQFLAGSFGRVRRAGALALLTVLGVKGWCPRPPHSAWCGQWFVANYFLKTRSCF
jgi:hypothetical protein